MSHSCYELTCLQVVISANDGKLRVTADVPLTSTKGRAFELTLHHDFTKLESSFSAAGVSRERRSLSKWTGRSMPLPANDLQTIFP